MQTETKHTTALESQLISLLEKEHSAAIHTDLPLLLEMQEKKRAIVTKATAEGFTFSQSTITQAEQNLLLIKHLHLVFGALLGSELPTYSRNGGVADTRPTLINQNA